jgi:hypothetical protein
MPTDIRVLPVPHSPTMRTEFAVLRYFTAPVIVMAWAGSGFRKSVFSAGAMESFGPCNGGYISTMREPSSEAKVLR